MAKERRPRSPNFFSKCLAPISRAIQPSPVSSIAHCDVLARELSLVSRVAGRERPNMRLLLSRYALVG